MPAWLHFPDWLYLWPGVFALILTLVAGIVPTHKELYEHKWVKISYIVVLAVLVCSEIAAISHDRSEQDRHHLQELRDENDKFEQQMAYLMSFRQSVVGELNDVNANLKKARAEAPDQKSFKVTVLELAKDLLEFAADKEEIAPRFPIFTPMEKAEQERQAYENVSDAYNKQAMAEFHKRFDGRIAEVLPGLKAKEAKYMTPNGLNTRGTDMFCRAANAPAAIRLCGMELTVLGRSLP